MSLIPLPTTSPLRDAEPVIAAFGFLDLHDAELRAVRLALGPGDVSLVEFELRLPGEYALPSGTADRGAEYRIIIRCTDVADLALADFEDHNVVAEWAIESVGAEPADGRGVHVTLTCAPGADVELRCRSAAVVEVAPIATREPMI